MKNEKLELIIDPRARLVFASYYLYGLYELFGKRRIKFRMKPFVDLDQKSDKEAFDHYFAFLFRQESKETKFVIDYRDKSTINTNAYEWCDIYGKINLNSRNTEKKYLQKSVALGPMTGLNIWSKPQTIYNFLMNYQRCKRHISVSRRYYLAGYTWQLRRPTLEDYRFAESEKDYIFFDSQLWTEENDAAATNEWRARFIRTCKSMDVQFQGGLFAQKNHPEYELYKDLLLDEFISTDEFVRRIKRSAVVFNTPSCHHGHGWKLGEFLAMGKAILSTPIENDLPAPLEHGKNIHYVEDGDEIKDALLKITGEEDYRKKLEQGALEYYNTYMTPSAVIRRLISSLQ